MKLLGVVAGVVLLSACVTPQPKPRSDEEILLALKGKWPKQFPLDRHNTRQYGVLSFGQTKHCDLLRQNKKGCSRECCITDVDYNMENPTGHSEHQLINDNDGLKLMAANLGTCPAKVYIYTNLAPCRGCHNQITNNISNVINKALKRTCPKISVIVGYSCKREQDNYDHLENVTAYKLMCVGTCSVNLNGKVVTQDHCNPPRARAG